MFHPRHVSFDMDVDLNHGTRNTAYNLTTLYSLVQSLARNTVFCKERNCCGQLSNQYVNVLHSLYICRYLLCGGRGCTCNLNECEDCIAKIIISKSSIDYTTIDLFRRHFLRSLISQWEADSGLNLLTYKVVLTGDLCRFFQQHQCVYCPNSICSPVKRLRNKKLCSEHVAYCDLILEELNKYISRDLLCIVIDLMLE